MDLSGWVESHPYNGYKSTGISLHMITLIFSRSLVILVQVKVTVFHSTKFKARQGTVSLPESDQQPPSGPQKPQ